MSFILDALKKSEAERQNQAGASISTTPRAQQRTQLPGWAMALMATLSLAVIALGWAWWQAQPSPGSEQPTAVDRPVAAPAGGPVQNLATVARRSTPAAGKELTSDAGDQPPRRAEAELHTTTTALEAPPVNPTPSVTVSAGATLPTNADLTAQGIALPDMNLDIHVFSGNPAERFVFINSSKYREGDRLRDGPRVEEITAEGVILNNQGISFLLPRD